MTGEEGLERAKQQLIEKGQKILSGGKAALDWAGNGFSRLYKSLPKIELLFPIFGIKEIPDPRSLRDPMGIARNIGKAFFSNDPMMPGKIIPPEEKEPPKYFKSSVGYFSNDDERRFLGKTEEDAKATLGIKIDDDKEEVSSEAQIDTDVSPTISETTSKVEQLASYEESEEEVIVTLPARQQQQSQPMMRSKSRVIMMGGDSVDRYYRSQLLGSLYKRG